MDLVWPVAAWALWIAALAAAFKVSGRERSSPVSEHPAPQPVVELLRGMRAQEVFHSALFELAGRGWVTIEGDRVSLAAPRAEPLLPYERWVLEKVTALLRGARQAPVIALMPEGADLESDFTPLVRQCAIDLGLARRRWPTMIAPMLLAGALVVPWYATISWAGLTWPGMIATMVAFVAGVGLISGGRGFLLTARGREAAGPESAPINPQQEWIFTGSGWPGVEIELPRRSAQGANRREIAGYVVKRWAEVESSGETGSWNSYHIAVHDGRSEKATAFTVKSAFYRDVLPGDSVRLLIDTRRGTVVRALAHERHW
ncbi:hypothetical protein ACTMTI_00515 [Nonomuraea sp. H19]|uniref:hypothetical protein n=1 Tax=Nonomuraea sp. H19 TaxID=3452206 RepID=UPI003F8CC8F1